jgi:hypothetical protein
MSDGVCPSGFSSTKNCRIEPDLLPLRALQSQKLANSFKGSFSDDQIHQIGHRDMNLGVTQRLFACRVLLAMYP